MKMMSTHMMIPPDMQVRRKKQKKLVKNFADRRNGTDHFSYAGTGASIIDRGRSFGDKLYFVIREYTKNKETKAVSSDYKGLKLRYDFAPEIPEGYRCRCL